MAKNSKKSGSTPRATTATDTTGSALQELLEKPLYQMVAFALLFVITLILYKPVVFDHKDASGGDVVANIGNTKQLRSYEESSGYKPLWNPYMFGGTPIYHRHNAISWSIDTLINALNPLLNWRIWYLMLAALGMFLLVKQLGLSSIAGLAAAAAFLLMPHFQALLVVGHFSKYRAIAWMPWAMLTFLMLLKRRDILSALFFTSAFALLMRTQHYQIIFYTMMLLVFAGLPGYIQLIRAKEWNSFWRLNGLFAASVVLVMLIVAQPLFITRDYAPYSTRGGNAVDIESQLSEQDKKGVGFDYATNWSYTIPEFWNLIVPRFHGGTSQELYTGDAVPQFKGQVIPTYWGDLPFTQSLEYMGVLVIFLALAGLLLHWKTTLVKSLLFLSVLAILLSLGKHFAPLYKLFFYYLPLFDQFRVPMMILTLVAFSACILAAYGSDALLKMDISAADIGKILYLLSGAYLVVLLVPLLFGSGFALSPANEVQRYAAQYGQQAEGLVALLKKARLEILQESAVRSLLYFLAAAGLIIAAMRNWLSKGVVLPVILILIVIDLGAISLGYLADKFSDETQVEARSYGETNLDRLVKQDKSLYRVLPPLRQVASDSRYTYHYQSIGGYSPAKLQVIQDIIENNLARPSDTGLPFNLPVVSMLNGKYIFSDRPINHPSMEPLGGAPSQGGLQLYRNREVLPRAFFVRQQEVIPNGPERLNYLNRSTFNPAQTAILEQPLATPVGIPDSLSMAIVSSFEPDKIVIETSSSQAALLVISEVYYPKGWTARLEDGTELEIFKTNHLLRSVVAPAGKHVITMEFHPDIYYDGVKASYAGWLVVWIGLLALGFRHYRERQG